MPRSSSGIMNTSSKSIHLNVCRGLGTGPKIKATFSYFGPASKYGCLWSPVSARQRFTFSSFSAFPLIHTQLLPMFFSHFSFLPFSVLQPSSPFVSFGLHRLCIFWAIEIMELVCSTSGRLVQENDFYPGPGNFCFSAHAHSVALCLLFHFSLLLILLPRSPSPFVSFAPASFMQFLGQLKCGTYLLNIGPPFP